MLSFPVLFILELVVGTKQTEGLTDEWTDGVTL